MEQTFFPVTRTEAKRAGIPYSSDDNKKAGFPSQLRELRKKKGFSQDVVSKTLGVSKSTLGLWETGDTLPDAKAICDLSTYYGVSADYLLGKTEYQTADITTREICEYIGLTPDTVTFLSVYAKQGETISSFLSRFFEDIVVINDAALEEISFSIVQSAHADAIHKKSTAIELGDERDQDSPNEKIRVEIDNMIDSMNGTHGGGFKISANDAKWYYLIKAQTIAKKMIDIILESMEEELVETFASDDFIMQTPQKRVWRVMDDEEE